MLKPLLVLLCAWLFGHVVKDLGLAVALGEVLAGAELVELLPVCTFILGCTLSFTTGTSWGTMALLFPVAFGALYELPDAELLSIFPVLVAAIFSGAVFGDHCSPYSDTTLVSAVAAGCDPYAHVKTQLPYALICGGCAALSFLLVGAFC